MVRSCTFQKLRIDWLMNVIDRRLCGMVAAFITREKSWRFQMYDNKAYGSVLGSTCKLLCTTLRVKSTKIEDSFQLTEIISTSYMVFEGPF